MVPSEFGFGRVIVRCAQVVTMVAFCSAGNRRDRR